MKTGEWTLRSRRVVTPAGLRAADVVIRDETIAQVAEYDGPESEGVILDAGDLVVMPGLVALHLDGPRCSDWRGFEATTRDSAAGGVTTLVDLPEGHGPGTNSPSAFRARMAAAEGKIRVDCGLVLGLGRGNAELIESWIESGIIGVEAFLDATEADFRGAMPVLASLGRPLLIHSGGGGRTTGSIGASDRSGSTLSEREFDAFRLLIRLCRETRCRVHLIHPTAIEILPMIAEARAEGLPLTVETCPSHLISPPAESRHGLPALPLALPREGHEVRERLWDALRSGLVDGIGLDHPHASSTSTCSAHDGLGPDRGGFTPLRLTLPVLWTEAKRRGFALDDLARWMASNTADAFGLSSRKGSILAGLDADFAVFDPDEDSAPDPDPPNRLGSPPPLDARTLSGRVEATILRGTLIYQAGQFFDHPRGAVVLRLEETQPIERSKPS